MAHDILGTLDTSDMRLLALLQEDASRPVAQLAEKINLSTNACWKRIKRLEDLGIIERRVALLNREKVGLGVTVFVSIGAHEHSEEWFQKFSEGVERIPEVVEFYRMSGEVDYLLKIVVSDIAAYDRVYKKLVKVVKLSDVNSAFALEQLKMTTAPPLTSRRSK